MFTDEHGLPKLPTPLRIPLGKALLNNLNPNSLAIKTALNVDTSKPLFAVVEGVNEQTGELTLRFLTATNFTTDTFKVNFTVPQAGIAGQHFFGGQYDIGDVVFVDVITRGKTSSYRVITQSVAFNYSTNHTHGLYQPLRMGEKLVQGKGGSFTYWDQAGNIHMESGFRQSAQEQAYRAAVDSQQIDNNPSIIHYRDYIRLWNDELPNQNQSLRTFQSIVNSTLVKWGGLHRINEYGNVRTFDRIDDIESEFLVSILDSDRRKEKSTLFLGFGHTNNIAPVNVFSSSEQAIGGFRFYEVNGKTFNVNPGLVWGQSGSFELTDGWQNRFSANKTTTTLFSQSNLQIDAVNGATFQVIGEYIETAGKKTETYTRGLTTTIDQGYLEVINSSHKITRNDSYEDILSSLASPTAHYLWQIDTAPGIPAPVSKILMDNTKIAFGQGSGTFVNIIFDSTKNDIEHTIANVINSPLNYFGTTFGNVIEPIIKGTTLSTLLTGILANLITMLTSLETMATSFASHIHPVTGASTGPSPTALIEGTATATALGAGIGTLTTSESNVINIISKKNFTE